MTAPRSLRLTTARACGGRLPLEKLPKCLGVPNGEMGGAVFGAIQEDLMTGPRRDPRNRSHCTGADHGHGA